MKLIIGLGNPGAEYEQSRHNFGWRALDFLAGEFGAGDFRENKKFRALIAETELNNEKIIFAKPLTFYNLSGETTLAIKQFYKLDNRDILVIHDEMDLPVGVMRTRRSGTAAGNNGIVNLIASLGEDFARIRIGSGVRETTSAGKSRPDSEFRDYVLSRPAKEETEILKQFLPEISQIVRDFANGEFRETTYKTDK